MSIFKKKQKEKPQCACNGSCDTFVAEKQLCNCGDDECKFNIKVLGAGCATCHKQYENVLKAVEGKDNIEVEYITDMQIVMQYGVMSMPAIVINEKVVAMGKLLSEKEITTLLS